MRQHIDLNRDWEFTERFDDFSSPAIVSLPHTCRETPYDYFDESAYQMVCGYRRRIAAPREWAGKRVFLCVGAAGHSAEVYLDGVKLGEHHCGYTAFRVELTDALKIGGENELTIKVDSRETQNIPPFGYVIDYMTYGGLYREVWLEVVEPTCIEDVFARPTGDGTLRGTVTLSGAARGGMVLRERVEETVTAAPVSGAENKFTLTVPDAKRWDIDAPNLYTLVTELWEDGTLLDRVETRFGFRDIAFRADGFYLNGRKVKLRGLNRHQSYAYVGYAMPRSMQRLDAEILKNELGCNAVRTSHYPQSQHFIDRCDELGLLVFTETPGWQHLGDAAWKEQVVRNTEDMVRQYRNHPSIILWGVRVNESLDDDELYARTNAAAHTLDPTRPTGGVRYLKKSSFLEDVYTFNDFIHDGVEKGCNEKKDVTPDKNRAYLVTEYNGHMFPTKAFDSETHRLEHALRHANVLDAVAAQEDIAGSFGWCMFDYNTHRDFGSGDRICYHGVLDMYRNKKLAAEVYASQQNTRPVLEVSSSFDIGEQPASCRGRVLLFTNADEVRMYRSGELVHTYTPKDSAYKHLPHPPMEVDDFIGERIARGEGFSTRQAKLVTDILNHVARFGMNRLPPTILAKAGELMALYHMSLDDAYALYGKYVTNWGAQAMEFRFEAYKDGALVASLTRNAAAKRVLRAEASHTELVEGATYDVAAIRLAAVDQNGSVLHVAQEPVMLSAEGPIEIIGPKIAMLRGGLGGTYVKTTGQTGRAALTLTLSGAAPIRIEFTIDRR